jgi:Ca-activated chloride channel homolog
LSVNARARNSLAMFVLLAVASACHGQESVAQAVRDGNRLYAKKDWQGAMAAYDKAASIDPASDVPKFNKAGALYGSGDFAGAADGFRAVAGESRDLTMVAKAKYNLANCAFKEGMRQKDSDLKKAVDSIKQSIVGWREVLAYQPGNKKATDNIAKAALELKKIMDEQEKRQQQQKNDPNSQQQQQQKQQDQNQQQGQGQQQKEQQQDPNKPGQQDQQKKQEQPEQSKDQQGKQEQEKKSEQKKDEQKDGQEQPKAQEQKQAPDATAEQILNDEKERKKDLRPGQPGGYQPVDQDW